MPPEPPLTPNSAPGSAPPRTSRALLAALAAGLAASVVLALVPGTTALFPALFALSRDVAAHDSETLRREHDGWYVRMLPVYAAIEALPPDEPLLLVTDGVPPWFVAAHVPTRRVFADSEALRAELAARQLPFHVLTMANGDPIRWTLLPASAAPR